MASKGLAVDPYALTEAVRLGVMTALAEARYPLPATKSIDPEWVTTQLRKQRDYLRLLAAKMGVDPDEACLAIDRVLMGE